jgi:hypothetical protein
VGSDGILQEPDRLLDGDIASKFFAGVLNLPQIRRLLSSEHFSVDGNPYASSWTAISDHSAAVAWTIGLPFGFLPVRSRSVWKKT